MYNDVCLPIRLDLEEYKIVAMGLFQTLIQCSTCYTSIVHVHSVRFQMLVHMYILDVLTQ